MATKISRRVLKRSLRYPSLDSEACNEVQSSSHDAAELLLSLSTNTASALDDNAARMDGNKRRCFSKGSYSSIHTLISDDEDDEVNEADQLKPPKKVESSPPDWRSVCRPLAPPPRLPAVSTGLKFCLN